MAGLVAAHIDAGEGTLDISSTGRARGLFTVPSPAGAAAAVIVTPRSFTGTGNDEDSLLLERVPAGPTSR